MTESKPDCGDFIIATLRAIRVPGGNTAPGIATGVRLDRIWRIAEERYTWEEFSRAINSLIKSGAGLMTGNKYTNVHVLLREIPADFPAPTSWRWPVNEKGELSARVAPGQYYSSVKFYVVADGLPDVVQKILNPKKKRPVTAEQIIASMRTSHT